MDTILMPKQKYSKLGIISIDKGLKKQYFLYTYHFAPPPKKGGPGGTMSETPPDMETPPPPNKGDRRPWPRPRPRDDRPRPWRPGQGEDQRLPNLDG